MNTIIVENREGKQTPYNVKITALVGETFKVNDEEVIVVQVLPKYNYYNTINCQCSEQFDMGHSEPIKTMLFGNYVIGDYVL